MSDKVHNFKVIIALKSSKDQKYGPVNCTIHLHDKVKQTLLPQSEGQFFDINELNLQSPIQVIFEVQKTGQRIGDIKIAIPSTVYKEKEVELADQFSIDFFNDQGEKEKFSGRYYIIIMNKGEVQLEEEVVQDEPLEDRAHKQLQQAHQQRTSESPTKQYIKSTGERTQERSKKEQSKKILQETKFDPKESKNSTKKQPGRASQAQIKQPKASSSIQKMNKYESTSNIDSKIPQSSHQQQQQQQQLTPTKDNQRNATPPKQQSPFSKYKGKSQSQLTAYDFEADLEYWKGVAQSYENQKMRTDCNQQLLDQSEKNFHNSEEQRKELQELVRQGMQEGEKLKEEIERRVMSVISENKGLIKNLKAKDHKITQVQDEINKLQGELRDREFEVKELKDKLRGQEEVKRICSNQQKKLEEQDAKIKENQKQYAEQIKGLVNQISKLENQYTQLLAEKQEANMTIGELRAQIQKQAEDQQLQKELQVKESKIQGLIEELNKIKEDIQKILQEKDNRENVNQDKIQALKEVLKGQDLKIAQLESQIKNYEKQIQLLKEQLGRQKVDKDLTDMLQKRIDQYAKDYSELLKENNSLTKMVEELTESLQGTNNQILELRADVLNQKQQREEIEEYHNNLKKLILEMRERGIAYMPAQNDILDSKLAQFINSKPDADKYRQLFVRESSGVYQFGSKKVYVKMEKDKILIRSGGGYVQIEEFLNLYSQREMESQQRGDPLQAITKNKAVQRKIDSMKCVNKIKQDTVSPLSKKSMEQQKN